MNNRQCDLRGPVSPITPTSQAPDHVGFKKLRGVCDRLSLASQLMALSDTSLEQVWLVPLLLALKSGLPTNTTASFSATAALARAYVNLASFLCCQSLLTTGRMSTSSRRAVRRLLQKLTNHSQVRFELAWKACDPVRTCCSLKLPQQES